ncbi:MAG: hypothetical protein K0A95_11645 [Chromatiales bacterium]|nr:hypothetical protein [Gammaproteobacteria bacterium]MBW6477710.1 hypothetical protein [Chromatiales bacterium]
MKIKERHIFAGVIGFTLLSLALAMLIPAGDSGHVGQHLPWQITLDEDGHTRVFGVTLGKSPLSELEQLIREPVVISLFARDSGERVVEAFFDNVALGGLRAKMVVVLEFDPATLDGLYQRGVRIATLGSGTRKVTLSSEDMALVRAAPIASITYLPRSRLSEELVEQRFGKAAEQLTEGEDGTRHWLYPELGLGIALPAKGGNVFQYVLPERFEALRQPLLTLGEEGGPARNPTLSR